MTDQQLAVLYKGYIFSQICFWMASIGCTLGIALAIHSHITLSDKIYKMNIELSAKQKEIETMVKTLHGK